jgi:cytolysin (calcineurin-like family phosphatase)
MQGAGTGIHPAGKEGVKHTVDWYRSAGVASAHAEWNAHMRDLLHTEVSTTRAKPFWYE